MPGGTPWVNSGAGLATARQWLSSYRMTSPSITAPPSLSRSGVSRLQGQQRGLLLDLLLEVVEGLHQDAVLELLLRLAVLLLVGLGRLRLGTDDVAVRAVDHVLDAFLVA